MEILVEEPGVGAFGEPEITLSEFCQRLGIDKATGEFIVDQLEGCKLVERFGGSGESLIEVHVTDNLFREFDRMFKDWNVEDDALAIAEKLINGEHPGETS